MEIARKFKEEKYRIMTLLGHDAITCAMYNGFMRIAIEAFQKISTWALMSLPLPLFVFLLSLMLVFFVPFILVFFNSQFIWLILIIVVGKVSCIIAQLSKSPDKCLTTSPANDFHVYYRRKFTLLDLEREGCMERKKNLSDQLFPRWFLVATFLLGLIGHSFEVSRGPDDFSYTPGAPYFLPCGLLSCDEKC